MIENHLRNSIKIRYEGFSKEVPTQGRGIYAAWLEADESYECIYMGRQVIYVRG